jgi:hypothetical protein
MRLLIISLLLLLFINGCDPYKAENDQLKERADSLQTEVDSIKNSPSYMYGLAYDRIDRQQYDEAKEILFDLNRRYPSWNQNLIFESINHINRLQNPERQLLDSRSPAPQQGDQF